MLKCHRLNICSLSDENDLVGLHFVFLMNNEAILALTAPVRE